MATNPNQPLVQNEAPPAYSPPAGAAGGYNPIEGDNKGAPAGAAGYQGGYQQQVPPAGYAGQPPPAGYAPGYGAPAGYAGGQPSYMQQPPAGQATVIVQPQPSVVVVGGCPACRIGVLEDDFTCLGVCCAIVFFPIGILCCIAMRQRHCPNCGAVFG